MSGQDYGPEYEVFRGVVRQFLMEHWGAAPRKRSRQEMQDFRIRATEAGLIYRSVPRQYGGAEQTPDVFKAQIIREEFDAVRAPREVRGNGVMMLTPTLLVYGTDWQKQHFIPPTVRGEYIWAQGYSEPNAGSDLASIQTRGVLENGQWVITGQKVWTTDGPSATHMFALARTEPNAVKHQGISYLLLDLRQSGVTVRPLRQITGSSEFSEVFLDRAVTPADWIVGERGEGWKISRKTLQFERNSVGASEGSLELFEKLLRFARTTPLHGRPAIQDPVIRDQIARLEGFVQAHRCSGLTALYRDGADKPVGGMSLVNKQFSANIAQEIAGIAQKIMNDHALLGSPEDNTKRGGPERWVAQYFNSIAAAIGGGTSNIHRNIIAERLLGLPRELET